MRQSRCPHESLRNSFENYSGMSDGKIFFDDAQSDFNLLAVGDFKDWLRSCDACPQLHLVTI